jgi:hypothetical protein
VTELPPPSVPGMEVFYAISAMITALVLRRLGRR